jgi:hypothetical protein
MSKTNDNSTADPKELEKAQELWGSFTNLMKWGSIATIILVVLMAAFLM